LRKEGVRKNGGFNFSFEGKEGKSRARVTREQFTINE